MRALAPMPQSVTSINVATDKCIVCRTTKVRFFRLASSSGREKGIGDMLWSLFQIKIVCGVICRTCLAHLQKLHKNYENMKTQLLRNSDLRHEEQTPSSSSHSLNAETGIGKLSGKQSEQESRSICKNITVHQECPPFPTKVFSNLCSQPLLDKNNPMTKSAVQLPHTQSKVPQSASLSENNAGNQQTGTKHSNLLVIKSISANSSMPVTANSINQHPLSVNAQNLNNTDVKVEKNSEQSNVVTIIIQPSSNNQIQNLTSLKNLKRKRSADNNEGVMSSTISSKFKVANPAVATPVVSDKQNAGEVLTDGEICEEDSIIDVKPLEDSNSHNKPVKTGSEKENTKKEKIRERIDRLKFQSIMKAYPKLAPLILGDNKDKQESIDNKRYKLCIDGSQITGDKQTIAEDHSYTLPSKETVQKVLLHYDSGISINHSDDDCNDPPEEKRCETSGAVYSQARWASALESLGGNSTQETDCIKCSKYFTKSNSYLLREVLDVFQWKSILNENLEEGKKRKKSLECEYCGLQLLISFHIGQHLYVHVCGICKIGTTRGEEYELHMSTVHSLKLNTCKYCNKKFTLTRSLDVHVRKCHTGDRNYVCSKCGKNYMARYELKRHIDFVHRKIRPHVCKCGASFGREYLLKRHQANKVCTQTIKRCNLCKQDFQNSRKLNVHMRTVHPEIMPYLCRFCGEGFSVKRLLHSHERSHVVGIIGFRKKYPVVLCEICGKAIRGERYLKKHLKRHNRNGSFDKCITNMTKTIS